MNNLNNLLKQDFPMPTLKELVFLVGLVLIPNCIFLTLVYYTGVSRPFINIDYLIAIIFFFIPYKMFRVFGLVFLFFSMLVDALMYIVQIFPFMDLAAIWYLASFIPQAPPNYILLILLIIISMIVVSYLITHITKYRCPSNIFSIFFLTLLLIISYVFMVLNVSYANFKAILGRDNYYVSHSQILLYRDTFQGEFNELLNTEPKLSSLEPHQKRISDYLVKPSSEKILFILAESWGQLRDSSAQMNVIQSLIDEKNSFVFLHTGSSRALGATVSGELRELCGLKITNNGFALGRLEQNIFKTCLPNAFKEQGYKTYAVHGTSGLLYDRVNWYPKAGFKEILFGENFLDLERCEAFKGVCDRELVNEIAKIFSRNENERTFVYWMTLTSHQPYAKQDIYNSRFNCEKFNLDPVGDVCRNSQLQTQFFDELARLIQKPEMKGVEIIVVGDHAPPMWSEDDISQIIPWKISWLHLQVK